MTQQLPPAIAESLDWIESTARWQATVLARVHNQIRGLMADAQDLLTEIASLRQMIVDDNTNDQKAVDALRARIAQLEAALAAGNDTSAAIAALKDVESLIKPVDTGTAGETPVP